MRVQADLTVPGMRIDEHEPPAHEGKEEVTTWVRIMPIAALAAETTVEGDNFN